MGGEQGIEKLSHLVSVFIVGLPYGARNVLSSYPTLVDYTMMQNVPAFRESHIIPKDARLLHKGMVVQKTLIMTTITDNIPGADPQPLPRLRHHRARDAGADGEPAGLVLRPGLRRHDGGQRLRLLALHGHHHRDCHLHHTHPVLRPRAGLCRPHRRRLHVLQGDHEKR